jgi:hypothetical protein
MYDPSHRTNATVERRVESRRSQKVIRVPRCEPNGSPSHLTAATRDTAGELERRSAAGSRHRHGDSRTDAATLWIGIAVAE